MSQRLLIVLLLFAGCQTINVTPESKPMAPHPFTLTKFAPVSAQPTGWVTHITRNSNGGIDLAVMIVATNGQAVIIQGTRNLDSRVWFDLYRFIYCGTARYTPCADLGGNCRAEGNVFYRLRFTT